MTEVCPDCGCKYTSLGSHWAISDCDYPEPTEYQKEILTGVLMGDGFVRRKDGRNPYFVVSMTNEEYLEYLNKELGIQTISVSLSNTASEQAEEARNNGFDESASKESYSNIFTLRGRSNPALSELSAWYKTGEKVFPEEILLTSTVLKHWYVCDGSLHPDGYIQIGVQNERDNFNKLKSYFSNMDLPEPKENSYPDNCIAVWGTRESDKLFEYMGEPLPGFEYKW